MSRLKRLFERIKRVWRLDHYTITFDPKYIPKSVLEKRIHELTEELREKYHPNNTKKPGAIIFE